MNVFLRPNVTNPKYLFKKGALSGKKFFGFLVVPMKIFIFLRFPALCSLVSSFFRRPLSDFFTEKNFIKPVFVLQNFSKKLIFPVFFGIFRFFDEFKLYLREFFWTKKIDVFWNNGEKISGFLPFFRHFSSF